MSVTLVVTNQTRSLEFFTQKVGFEKKTDVAPPGGTRYVTVGPKGHDLEIVLWEMGTAVGPGQENAAKTWSPGRTPPISLGVADCEKTYQELSLRGVEFPQPAFKHPWGTSATFRDPDGNLFTLNQLRGR